MTCKHDVARVDRSQPRRRRQGTCSRTWSRPRSTTRCAAPSGRREDVGDHGGMPLAAGHETTFLRQRGALRTATRRGRVHRLRHMTENAPWSHSRQAGRCAKHLPGIGPLRAADRLPLLQHHATAAVRLGEALLAAAQTIRHCELCNTLTESRSARRAAAPMRDAHLLCVVDRRRTS